MENKRIDEATQTETVGHEWDGIEELNTPLPRWWLWTFYGTIAFALVYVVLYPAFPMLHSASQGVLGWSSRGQLAKDMEAADESRRGVREQIAAVDIAALPDNADLMQKAVAGGAAAFKVNCVQCHGAGAAGSQTLGYPNLNDDDWLWGGDIKTIAYTITHGVRQPSDDELRQSAMPPFAGVFEPKQLDALATHVLSLSGKAKDNAQGAQLYSDNCVSCHGDKGQGDRAFGAPRLNDAIWLYGDTKADIERQVQDPRMGQMPHWGGRLDPVTIKMLAAYVYSLGGGEDMPDAGTTPPEVTEQVNGQAQPGQ